MTLPAHSRVPFAATLGGASLLRLAAGVAFLVAAVLSTASCADAVEAYCNANCMDATATPALGAMYRDDCVATLEGAEHEAEHASCNDAFQTYFRCEQQAGPSECGSGDSCFGEKTALVACMDKNDPDSVCVRALEHFNACDPVHAEPFDPLICAGILECNTYCILHATCDDITSTDGPNDLTRCEAACPYAQSLGVLTPFEGD